MYRCADNIVFTMLSDREFCYRGNDNYSKPSNYIITFLRIENRKDTAIHGLWALWHFRLWSFQGRDTKLERFLSKNQLYSNKITKF